MVIDSRHWKNHVLKYNTTFCGQPIHNKYTTFDGQQIHNLLWTSNTQQKHHHLWTTNTPPSVDDRLRGQASSYLVAGQLLAELLLLLVQAAQLLLLGLQAQLGLHGGLHGARAVRTAPGLHGAHHVSEEGLLGAQGTPPELEGEGRADGV